MINIKVKIGKKKKKELQVPKKEEIVWIQRKQKSTE